MSDDSHSDGMLQTSTIAPPTTVFMLLSATEAWHALPRHARDALMDALFVRVYESCPGVRLRQYDAAGFDGAGRAVLVWEVRDAGDWREATALLHEHELLREPYLRLVDTVVAAEVGAGEPVLQDPMCWLG